MPPLMSKKQLADFMGVSTKTIDLYRKLGLIDAIKVRGTVRFPSPYVVEFLRRHQEVTI